MNCGSCQKAWDERRWKNVSLHAAAWSCGWGCGGSTPHCRIIIYLWRLKKGLLSMGQGWVRRAVMVGKYRIGNGITTGWSWVHSCILVLSGA
jgi:hypothetical protein